jgi:hypothetical protein
MRAGRSTLDMDFFAGSNQIFFLWIAMTGRPRNHSAQVLRPFYELNAYKYATISRKQRDVASLNAAADSRTYHTYASYHDHVFLFSSAPDTYPSSDSAGTPLCVILLQNPLNLTISTS